MDIKLENDEISDAFCSCPYAQGENEYCKHMAAALFAAEEDAKPKTEPREIPWQDILKTMTEAQLRDFLGVILPQNRVLQEQLMLGYQQLDDPEALQGAWGQALSGIVYRCRSGKAYIDDYHANQFCAALYSFLEDRLPVLLSAHKTMLAFRLVCCVFNTARKEEVEDSDDGMERVMGACCDGWNEILNAAPPDQQEEIYQWFHNKVQVLGDEDICKEAVEDFLFHYAWDTPYLQKNLLLLDRMLQAGGNSQYRVEALLLACEATMQALHQTEAEMDAFWEKYRAYDFVRERQLKRCLETEDYPRAIALLKQEKRLFADSPKRVRHSCEELIRLYRLTGQGEDYCRELLYLIANYPQEDMTYIRELRSMVRPSEWAHWTQRLLNLPTTEKIHLELLAYDKRWPQLFDEIAQQGDLYALERYMEPLMKWSPENTMQCCGDCLRRKMDAAGTRDAYQTIFSHMASLKQYPGGKELIDRLLQLWKEQYCRKKALMDEMEKAKKAGLI